MNNNYQVTSQYGLNTSNGLCGKVVASSELFGDNYFMRFEWFVDEVLAYFSANASGRQELYEFAVVKLGADKASESDKARVQRNLQQVANMAGLSTEDWRFLVSDNIKFNAYALPA